VIELSKSGWAGAIGVTGLFVQVALGFVLAGNHELYITFLLPHIFIGICGLALVGYLAWRAFSGTSGAVKLLYVVTLAFVFAQVALGFGILEVGYYELVMVHQYDAYAILFLLFVTEILLGGQKGKAAASDKPS
jgi:heme A synthase